MVELTKQVQELRTAMAALTQRLDAQSQVQHTVLSVASPQGPRAEQTLLGRGIILTTEQIEDLNNSAVAITISNWLRGRIDSRNGSNIRKVSYIFSKELKKAKLAQAEQEGIDVPLLWNQGGHRIVYTTCDEDLMSAVFNDLKNKFDKIIELDDKLSDNHAKKKGVRKTIHKDSIERFLKPTGSPSV